MYLLEWVRMWNNLFVEDFDFLIVVVVFIVMIIVKEVI